MISGTGTETKMVSQYHFCSWPLHDTMFSVSAFLCCFRFLKQLLICFSDFFLAFPLPKAMFSCFRMCFFSRTASWKYVSFVYFYNLVSVLVPGTMVFFFSIFVFVPAPGIIFWTFLHFCFCPGS